ncbi:major capsid protein [Gordonia phage Banquo]|uniref:Major capsid protein n=1 Tax=Gordonia phage TinaLin TaxID=2797324 RepID=A0A7T7GTD9_9CAUD|nr:major capsid protein [Gordonia phage TinaLin]QQM15102.1 major capsid protein [Gordonia phage TinaLin]URM87345.1 major capsid protein [Gordonia phage Banquo]
MNLKDQRSAVLAKAQAIVDSAAGAELTEEKSAELDGFVAEIEALDARIERAQKDAGLLDAVKSFGAKSGVSEVEKPAADKPAKSIGEHFVKSLGDNFHERIERGVKAFSAPEFIPSKAASDLQMVPGSTQYALDQLVDVDLNIQREKRNRLVVADLMGKAPINGTTIRYYLEGEFEGDFTTVAEGALKPQVHVAEPTPVEDSVKKIAAWIGFTDEILEDMPRWVAEINNRLLYKLSVFEEAQLLRGNGTGTNLRGILNRVGIQAEASADPKDNADAIFRAMTKIETATDYMADGLVIHPLDYERFRLSKDANEQYYGGGYFTGQYGNGGVLEKPALWGLRTVVSPVAEVGKPIVANWGQAMTLYRKGGVRVESTISDQDDFVKNRVKTRVEERIGLAVRQPKAVVQVTLSDGSDDE